MRGDLDGLRTRTAADGGSAARQLVELMTQQSQFGEAQQLQRFGLNLDLAREGKRYLKAPGRKVNSMRRESGSVGNRFPT